MSVFSSHESLRGLFAMGLRTLSSVNISRTTGPNPCEMKFMKSWTFQAIHEMFMNWTWIVHCLCSRTFRYELSSRCVHAKFMNRWRISHSSESSSIVQDKENTVLNEWPSKKKELIMNQIKRTGHELIKIMNGS